MRSRPPGTPTHGTSPPGESPSTSSAPKTSSSTAPGSGSTTPAARTPGSEAPKIPYAEAERTLAALEDITDRIVLVGGQNTGFWVDRFLDSVPELAADVRSHGPLTSKDIDFVGGRDAAQVCADRLHGVLQVADIDHATPNPLVVHYVDGRGHARLMDFLDRPHGVSKASEIYDTAITVHFLDPSLAATGRTFRVAHPLIAMECRVSNVVDIPKYRGDDGKRQARLAILCAREFSRRVLEAAQTRDVLNMNERIFRFRDSETGRTAAEKYGLDAFGAVLVDDRLGAKFRKIRYPQMQRALEQPRRGRGRGGPGR